MLTVEMFPRETSKRVVQVHSQQDLAETFQLFGRYLGVLLELLGLALAHGDEMSPPPFHLQEAPCWAATWERVVVNSMGSNRVQEVLDQLIPSQHHRPLQMFLGARSP